MRAHLKFMVLHRLYSSLNLTPTFRCYTMVCTIEQTFERSEIKTIPTRSDKQKHEIVVGTRENHCTTNPNPLKHIILCDIVYECRLIKRKKLKPVKMTGTNIKYTRTHNKNAYASFGMATSIGIGKQFMSKKTTHIERRREKKMDGWMDGKKTLCLSLRFVYWNCR